MISPEFCEEVLARSSDDNGVECEYYDCGKFGLKVWNDSWKAGKCRDIQIELHREGLAPKVMSELFEVRHNSFYYWCFATEKAEIVYVQFAALSEKLTKELREETGDDRAYVDYWEKCEAFYDTEAGKNYKKFKQHVYEMGWVDEDAHLGNYGFLPNGNCVVIDTGAIERRTDCEW